jgi:ABC-type multidrug transport system ATPase subunit
MQGRTVILVSHHVQLCVSGASYVVALENGQVQFSGKPDSFLDSGVMSRLVQSVNTDENDEAFTDDTVRTKTSHSTEPSSETSSTVVSEKQERKSPRKLVEEEKRAVGRIKRDIWETYIRACGDARYWVPFILILVLATLTPVAENGWLK